MTEPYVFHCTPCGRAHGGECPPRAAAEPGHWMAPGVPAMGSKWRRDMVMKDTGKRQPGTWVYTVYQIEGGRVGLHLMSMGMPVNGGSIPLSGWTPEGYLDDRGNRHYMMLVCFKHHFKIAARIDLYAKLECTKCSTTRNVGILGLKDLMDRGEVEKPVDKDPAP